MRNFSRILIATALSTLALTTWAAKEGGPVKTSDAPYKPGREIDDGGSAGSGTPAQQNRASDDGVQPVRSSNARYKPGREADDGQGAGNSNNK